MAEIEMVSAPNYRGYAQLGAGLYLLDHSAEGEPAELVISIATEEEREGRVVGDLRDFDLPRVIDPEKMAVRLRFETVAGLDALEQQLRLLREVHFPTTQRALWPDSLGSPELMPLRSIIDAAGRRQLSMHESDQLVGIVAALAGDA